MSIRSRSCQALLVSLATTILSVPVHAEQTSVVISCNKGSINEYLGAGWRVISTSTREVKCGSKGYGVMGPNPYFVDVVGPEVEYILEREEVFPQNNSVQDPVPESSPAPSSSSVLNANNTTMLNFSLLFALGILCGCGTTILFVKSRSNQNRSESK